MAILSRAAKNSLRGTQGLCCYHVCASHPLRHASLVCGHGCQNRRRRYGREPPPLPLPPFPIFLGQFLAQTEDLCDTLRMEVKSRKTDIGQ